MIITITLFVWFAFVSFTANILFIFGFNFEVELNAGVNEFIFKDLIWSSYFVSEYPSLQEQTEF